MNTPSALAGEMAAAIEHMRNTGSNALVRVGSQWWAAEKDLPIGLVDPAKALEISATASRRDRDRLMITKPVFWTGTVQALVRRRALRFVGRKTKPPTPPYTPSHGRAELSA